MNMDIAAIVEDFFAALKSVIESLKDFFESLFGGLLPGGEGEGDDE